MGEPPPIPQIPTQPTLTSSRRRRSLPSSSEPRSRKRSPNYIRNQPASPEVISSLIDSLSAISTPAHNLFENGPTVDGKDFGHNFGTHLTVGLGRGAGGSISTPSSPAAFQTAFPGNPLGSVNGGGGSFGVEYGKGPTIPPQQDHGWEYPDDAAEPPVVKTSKPPSGLSPLTAPKTRKGEGSLKNYLRSHSRSSTSLHSNRGGGDESSMGSISIEAGPRMSSASRDSSESRRSSRGHMGLMYMSSRERLKSRDGERKRTPVAAAGLNGVSSNSDSSTPQKPGLQTPTTKKTYLGDSAIHEEPPVAGPSRLGDQVSTPLRNGKSPMRDEDIESPSVAAAHGMVPERNSSLRHSNSPSRRKPRRHTPKGSRPRKESVPEEIEEEKTPTLTPPIKPEPKVLHDSEEDNEVTLRIKELKRQKELRDIAAGKLSVGAAGAHNGTTVSSSPNREQRPTHNASTPSEADHEASTAKARKVLGLTEEVRTSPKARRPRALSLHLSHAMPDPDLELEDEDLGYLSESEDLSSLPINYQATMQALERTSTPSSKASSRDNAKLLVRSKTAVGGRSAAARKVMAKNPTSPVFPRSPSFPKDHRNSSGDLSLSLSPHVSSPPRQHSMHIVPTQQTSSPPISRTTSKKKRWSHPDLPLAAEKKHNARVGDHAVKPPVAHPVIEERPSSVGSVDEDVEDFLRAPRLSQKVRHPQTGRIISFSEVGDPHGFAVFVCVGMGLTRYITAFYDELAMTLKLRLITPDRPGVGESQSDPSGTPLSWPDDVLAICQALKITKFSIMAHSAGAVYALATALRMPGNIRGRVHLLAPWIPPSQMSPVGLAPDLPPGGQLPKSQRFLRVLPTPFLKVANSSFMSATSASITRSVPKSPQRTKNRKSAGRDSPMAGSRPSAVSNRRESMMLMDQVLPKTSSLTLAAENPDDPNHEAAKRAKAVLTLAEQERRQAYDARLTLAIWGLATTNANPAVDLLVCLERSQPIGFRYVDITRAVVIHHGSRDTRVPVDNVKWLGRTMRRCEVRILEGEGHGLMASAVVMGNVLTEMAKEWEDWTAVTEGKRGANNYY